MPNIKNYQIDFILWEKSFFLIEESNLINHKLIIINIEKKYIYIYI